ncbi:MAG TPA: hypothetical protein VK815_14180 [Candidatus Acidoferrales bacterium]|jgi:hypothetical protein|nr:hypothetical protein [Candidatus Acidoferrales bacterium]
MISLEHLLEVKFNKTADILHDPLRPNNHHVAEQAYTIQNIPKLCSSTLDLPPDIDLPDRSPFMLSVWENGNLAPVVPMVERFKTTVCVNRPQLG